MVYLLKNTNETPRKIVLNCYISFFQIDTFRFAGFMTEKYFPYILVFHAGMRHSQAHALVGAALMPPCVSSEEREVHAAVAAVLHKPFVRGEVVVLSVFEHQQSALLQQSFLEYERRYAGQFFQRVWRVGEDEVELLPAALHESEGVASYEHACVGAYLCHALAYESRMVAVCLHAHHAAAPAREQFERYAARTCEEVESRRAVQLHVSVHHVEYVFFGKIGGRPRLERARNVEVTSLVQSCYYPHLPFA